MSVIVEVDIPVAEFEQRSKLTERNINRALVKAVKDILKRVEQAQIKIYTQNTRPSKPPNSLYRRTFVLQGSSETEVTSEMLPVIEGEWRATAPHAPYVLGNNYRQAFVHRNRWKSIEEVEREVNIAAVEITEKRLEGI